MVNPGEVPITTVRFDKPEGMRKLLIGLDQKVCDQVLGSQRSPHAGVASPVQRHDLTRSVTSVERGKPVALPQGNVSRKASRWGCGYGIGEQANADR